MPRDRWPRSHRPVPSPWRLPAQASEQVPKQVPKQASVHASVQGWARCRDRVAGARPVAGRASRPASALRRAVARQERAWARAVAAAGPGPGPGCPQRGPAAAGPRSWPGWNRVRRAIAAAATADHRGRRRASRRHRPRRSRCPDARRRSPGAWPRSAACAGAGPRRAGRPPRPRRRARPGPVAAARSRRCDRGPRSPCRAIACAA